MQKKHSAQNYMKQKLKELKGEIDCSAVTVKHQHTTFTGQTIYAEAQQGNRAPEQHCKKTTVYPMTAEYISFLSTQGVFSRIQHVRLQTKYQ